MSYSINFALFKNRLTTEIRNFWYTRTAFEYSERWWKDKLKNNTTYEYITRYPGDDNNLFGNIDLPPTEYIDLKDDVIWSVRGNTITNIVTAFETYLYYQTKRAIYLKPEIIESSDITFTAGELGIGLSSNDQQDWIAEEVVKKYIRNNSHGKMIKKIDTLIKGGICNGESKLIDRWKKIVSLRNALVHNSRLVNKEVSELWPEKFKTIGEKINLEDGDVIKTHYVAYELLKKIDKQFIRAIINDEDARLLSRVIYLLERKKENGEIAQMVFSILNNRFSKDSVNSAVAYQKKTREFIPDFNVVEEVVTIYNNNKIYPSNA